jgi:hypothetical protein
VEPPGGESGNIEHTWGLYNKPTGCNTHAYRAPHKQTNKQDNTSVPRNKSLTAVLTQLCTFIQFSYVSFLFINVLTLEYIIII